ncbi:MAG: ribonuclease HII [Maribacter sp.]|nr:ribonuclease HII [Eudoraea sp.]MBT8301438.1 ribonuclease HII [Maribacter sp.]NNK74489.1 ribonuclease HII [Maribacter sp.]
MLKRYYKTLDEVGTDEAGRGCLAGPVTAAALILPQQFKNEVLNDSKQLSEAKRETLKPIIEECAVCFGVAHIFPEEIDQINILNASILAMHKAIDQLNENLKFIIVDGNRFKPYHNIPFECIVKGDSKYMSIAAASVLAKTHRDHYMMKLHEEFPMYNWKKNKGYPTKEHRAAIRKFGITKYHRKSFRQLPEQLTLKL